jgi:uncharacterized protein
MEIAFRAAEQNNSDQILKLIDAGLDRNIKDAYGYSLLHVAASKRAFEVANVLIKRGINVNMVDKNGQTALHYCAEFGLLELAMLLVQAGAKLDIADKHGNQPLWTAIFNDKGRNDRINIIELFLQHGADPDHKNNVGKSPKDIVIIANYNNLRRLVGLF